MSFIFTNFSFGLDKSITSQFSISFNFCLPDK